MSVCLSVCVRLRAFVHFSCIFHHHHLMYVCVFESQPWTLTPRPIVNVNVCTNIALSQVAVVAIHLLQPRMNPMSICG